MQGKPKRVGVASLLAQGVATQHTKLKAGVRRHSFWDEVSAVPVADQYPLKLYKKLGPMPPIDKSSIAVSSLKPEGLEKHLSHLPGYPWLRDAAVHGVDLLNRDPVRRHVIRGNHPSAEKYYKVVEKYLTTGLKNNGIVAVASLEELQELCDSLEIIINPMGVVPKAHVPLDPASDKGRVITDSSFGGDDSLNAHIDTSDFPTVELDRLDAFSAQIRRLRNLVGKHEPLLRVPGTGDSYQLRRPLMGRACATCPAHKLEYKLQDDQSTQPHSAGWMQDRRCKLGNGRTDHRWVNHRSWQLRPLFASGAAHHQH